MGNYNVKEKVDVGDGHYRILSLDGGGLRAIIETVILSRLLEVCFSYLFAQASIQSLTGFCVIYVILLTGLP